MFVLLIQQNMYHLIAFISGLIVDYKAQCFKRKKLCKIKNTKINEFCHKLSLKNWNSLIIIIFQLGCFV